VKAGAFFIPVALAFLFHGSLAHAQNRRGGNPPEPPTLKGKVAAYEADASITIETKVRGGQTNKTEFTIVKGKTQIELGAGVKAIEVGITASVWAEKDTPKVAAKVVAEPEPPTVKGKVVAYEADSSITVETPAGRGREAGKVEFSIVKGKTRIELGGGAKAIEVGMTVSVYADKDNPKAAAKILAQGVAPGGRGRGGSGAAPADKGENPKPDAPKAEDAVDAKKVLAAYDSLKRECDLRVYQLRWAQNYKEAKEVAAKENRPILISASGNMHGNTFTGHT